MPAGFAPRLSPQMQEAANIIIPIFQSVPENTADIALKNRYISKVGIWGIELSFRELKYLVDMVHFHALKEEYIDQEVAAKLIMFNYSSAICNNVVVPNASKKESGLKYDRKVNFALGVTDCKKYWLYRISVEELCMRLLRFLTPEKKGRKAPRKIRSQRARSFNYRSSM